MYHGPPPDFKMEENLWKKIIKQPERFSPRPGTGLKELEAEIARSLKKANMRQLELILRIVRDITA